MGFIPGMKWLVSCRESVFDPLQGMGHSTTRSQIPRASPVPGIGMQQTHGFSFSFPANTLKSSSCFRTFPYSQRKHYMTLKHSAKEWQYPNYSFKRSVTPAAAPRANWRGVKLEVIGVWDTGGNYNDVFGIKKWNNGVNQEKCHWPPSVKWQLLQPLTGKFKWHKGESTPQINSLHFCSPFSGLSIDHDSHLFITFHL